MKNTKYLESLNSRAGRMLEFITSNKGIEAYKQYRRASLLVIATAYGNLILNYETNRVN